MAKAKLFTKADVLQFILNAVIILLIVLMLFPLGFALWNAFKTQAEYVVSKWYPTLPIRFSNIAEAFGYIKQYMLNTILVALVGTGGMLIISSLASYAIANIQFPGHKLCYGFVLMLMMMPGIITLVPQQQLYIQLNMKDNFFSLIFPIWSNGCLMSVFLLVIFFRGIPKDLYEAAEIDGASVLRRYIQIALPLSMPILGTATIIQIVSIWNDYLWQSVIMTEPFTIAAGLMSAFSADSFNFKQPVVYSGYLIASSPLILLFIFANKYYIQGLVGSSIKM